MNNVWFRVGMECEVTDEELEFLKVMSGEKEGEKDMRKLNKLFEDMISRGSLVGETYIPENYDNENYAYIKEVDTLF